MKRIILSLLLFVFSASAALCEPITAIIGVIAAIGELTIFGVAVSSIVGALAINAAIAVGITLLQRQKNKTPATQSASTQSPGARLVNLRQGLQDRTRGYGLFRTGGPVFFWKLNAGSRYVGVALNTGEIDSFVTHYFGERIVTLDGSGNVTTAEYQSGGVSIAKIQAFRGALGQTAPSRLTANFPEWTSSHTLSGIAGAVCVFSNTTPENFSTAYPDGREPSYTALIKGARVYDPRKDSTNGGSGVHRLNDTATWEWSANAALIMADWCTHEDGLNATVSNAWWQLVATEADASDVVVLDREGNSIAKWQLCGAYSLNEPREDVRSTMAIACDAFFYETELGEPAFFVGRYITPDVTITDEDIYSASITEGTDGTDVVNAVSVHYLSEDAGYRDGQTTAFYESNDNAYQENTITAYWAPNHNQGVRIAKRVLRSANARFRGSLKLKLRGLLLKGRRFFKLEFNVLGISQTFEIQNWKFSADENDQNYGMYIDVDIVSVTQNDFAFDAATEEPAPSTIADVTQDTEIPAPEGATLSSSDAGQLFASFNTPPRGSLVSRLRYRIVGATDWFYQNGTSGLTYINVNGLVPGLDYEADVQFRTSGGRESDWTTPTPTHVVIASTSSPPGPVTGVTVTPGTGNALFNWTAPNSPNYVGSRIYTNSTNSFAGSTLQTTEYGSPNANDSKTVTLSAATYYGWIVAINAAGDASTEVATGSFTVS